MMVVAPLNCCLFPQSKCHFGNSSLQLTAQRQLSRDAVCCGGGGRPQGCRPGLNSTHLVTRQHGVAWCHQSTCCVHMVSSFNVLCAMCRFGFKSDLLRAMYAVTDGFSGLNGTWDTPGTGMNFLVHNMVRTLIGAVKPGRPGKRGTGPAGPLTTSATLFTTSAA